MALPEQTEEGEPEAKQGEGVTPALPPPAIPAASETPPAAPPPPADIKYRIHCRARINSKVYGLHGQLVVFDGSGIAEVDKEQYDYLLKIPGYKAAG